MTDRRVRSGDSLLWAARIEAETISDAKAEGRPTPASSTRAVALVDKVRTKLLSATEVGVGGELVPSAALDERSLALRDSVADPDYVTADASRDRLHLLHETGALELGLDAADSVQAQNSQERMLAHQQAVLHRSTLKMAAQLDRRLKVLDNLSPTHPETMAVTADACRLGNTMARLTTNFQSGLLALERVRSGGKQHVVVQHIHQHVQVQDGGQAMVAGQVEAGARRKARGGRGNKNEQ
jgi:hypothetical protein